MVTPRLALGIFLAVATMIFAADSGRFSQSIKPEERTSAGLERLHSDQIAVLDALVRRDTAARGGAKPDSIASDSFSERLRASERELTGISLLTAEELKRLNEMIDRYASSTLARSLLAPPSYVTRSSRDEVAEKQERRPIHGSFSLSYGWGRGGYSERTGSMIVTYDDPEGRYALTIGYSESHVKGGTGYGVYRDGPPYRP